MDFGGIDALVAQFSKEAAIAAVDSKGDTTEIADEVVSRASVDMIDGHAGRNLLIAPGDIDGMGSKDMFTLTEGILELQILSIAMRVGFSALYRSCVRRHFSSVGIEADTDYPALSDVDIEGDVILGVRADIGDPHVVKEEGRADQIRLADDFKAALAQAFLIRNFIHKHRQSEGCLFRKAMQSSG